MMKGLSRTEARAFDRLAQEAYGISSLVLMENAGRGCAERIVRIRPEWAWVLCGTGNNGGDGLVIARHLRIAGISTRVLVFGALEKMSPDSRANFEIVSRLGLSLSHFESKSTFDPGEFPGQSVIVDALLGTGSRGAPEGILAEAIRWANRQAAYRVAIDIPSGLDCDSGEIHDPCFQADETLTMIASKIGLDQRAGLSPVGRIQSIHIGVSYVDLRLAAANRGNCISEM